MRPVISTATTPGTVGTRTLPLRTADPGRVLLLAGFTGTDGTGVTAYTPEVGPLASSGAYTIQSNKLRPPAVNESVCFWNLNKTSYSLFTTFSTLSGDPGPIVRVADTTNYVLCQLNSGGTSAIYKRVGGGYTALMTAVSITWVNGDRIRVDVTPTTVEVFQNGARVMNVTDSTFGTATGAGFRAAPAGTTVSWDDLLVVSG